MNKIYASPFRRSINNTRILSIFVIFIVLFIALAYKLYLIQVVKHKTLYKKAKARYTTVKRSKTVRGEIYDVNGNLLACDLPCVNIFANPQLINKKKKEFLSKNIAEKLNISENKILKRLSKFNNNGRRKLEVTICRNVPLDTAYKLKNFLEKNKINGLIFRETYKRYYPKGHLLSNTLGFVNISEDKVTAVSGIEKAYNSILENLPVENNIFERDRTGIPLFYGNSYFTDNKAGNNIYLTIDEAIQEIIEEELDNIVIQWRPKSAYAVMVNPRNGSVLAVGQRPTFNPNTRKDMRPDNWRNRLIEDGIEPGSIIKPLIVAKAMDMGVVKPETEIYCENGYWRYRKAPLHDVGHYGNLSVAEILEKSSNIGIAKIALMMGDKHLYNLLCDYGFGKPVKLPFHPKTRGILRPLSKWDSLSVTRFPIGQGFLSSPFQIVEAFTAIANHGNKVRLRIVDKIENPKTNKVYDIPIKIEKKIINNSNSIENIVKMMKNAVKKGTGKRASIKGYEVAGKSGTTQKWIDGKYSHNKCIASFIGFVPADDPAFILFVAVDEPKEKIYGGLVAAPAFKAIAYKTLKYLDIQGYKI